jgi:ubiquinone/menaquinone biosynthesis C-methylase UbiE
MSGKSFLGNAEFSYARLVLARLDALRQDEEARVLDLCCGPGFDILQIQECLADVRVTAPGFQGYLQEQALDRITEPSGSNGLTRKLKGFGSPLPFGDGTFDAAFFACA